MITVSIDMSKDDETYQNRIFGEIIDIENNTLICEYTGANYDFDNTKIIKKQQAEINRLREALDRILNYNSVKEQTDKYFYIVMDVRKIARKALNSESEEK